MQAIKCRYNQQIASAPENNENTLLLTTKKRTQRWIRKNRQ